MWAFELIDVHAPPLEGIDLGAPLGEVTAVVGPAGAGKTRLFRLCAGLERAKEGAVLVGGKDVGRARGRGLARIQRRMAVVFANDALFASVTVLENLQVAMRAAGRVPARRAEQVAYEELDRFGIAHLADRRPDVLSPPQARGLALARALALKAPMVLVDDLEPAFVPIVREECSRYGQTWLVTTADEAVAARVADRTHYLPSSALIRR